MPSRVGAGACSPRPSRRTTTSPQRRTSFRSRTEWPAGATFDIADVPGVGRVFTYTETHQSTDGTASGSDTDTWTVTTNSVTEVMSFSMSSSEGGSMAGEFRTTLTSSATPTRVVAPTAKALPELHVAYVSVSINGCGALPAAADCG